MKTGFDLNFPFINVTFITGSGTFTIVPSGINNFLVEIFANTDLNPITVIEGDIYKIQKDNQILQAEGDKYQSIVFTQP